MANRGSGNGGGTLGFEEKLWQAADQLRGHVDPSEYRNVVLGLIFLKYISDAFVEKYRQLQLQLADPQHAYYVKEPALRYDVLEDRDEYTAGNVFWVPQEARWEYIAARARQPEIGQIIDDAMSAIEAANLPLKGMLPKNYARPTLNKERLGTLVDLIGTIGLAGKAQQGQDVLGRVYEYFLGKFAQAEGKRGGQYYTPAHVVRLLVEMIEPYNGRVYDPCCGSGGMFVQSTRFVEEHGGQRNQLSIYGQESNPTTWQLCKINLAIRGISHDLGEQNADSFLNDLHPYLKADYVLANPPFNMKVWGGSQLDNDVRWQYGKPPDGNANFAWVQHIIHHLAPNGTAGFVLANGSLSSQSGGEGEIRRRMVEADLVDCIVALPGQLFYTTQIPVTLWFLSRNKAGGQTLNGGVLRDRRGETLFIDARAMGELVDRTHRELTEADVARITGAYHSWRGEAAAQEEFAAGYQDVPGFCKRAAVAEIGGHDFVLTPGRYVGTSGFEGDSEEFEETMSRLVEELTGQFAEAMRLSRTIEHNLRGLGYGIP